MKEKHLKIPDPSEHFSYVIINNSPHYKDDGRKSIRIADYIEFLKIAKEHNMKIDINYYLEKTVTMCTYFINKDIIFNYIN